MSFARVRRVLGPVALFGSAAGLAWFANARVPVDRWLFWPYAGFCLAGLVWALSCVSVGHAALRALPGLCVPFRERLAFDLAVGVLLFALGGFVVGLPGVVRTWVLVCYPLWSIALC